MTQRNFEKQIKEKLNKREISPSKEAWAEVSSSLEQVEKPSGKRFYAYGIAAGFIGLMIISVIYFTSKEEALQMPDNTQYVDIEKKENTKEKISDEMIIEQGPQPVEEERKPTLVEEIAKPVEKIVRSNKVELAVHEESQSEDEVLKVTINPTEKIIDAKLAEIIAQVDLLEQDKTTLTDIEVDSLLRKAQREILTDKVFREDQTVDATALLNEVEEELDQSFREQIFEKLKTGFQKVRTAVADRNN